MKKVIVFFCFILGIYHYSVAQSSIVTQTIQITNPASCTACCNGTVSVTNITYTCPPGGPPVSFALITSTTGTPIYGTTSSWTGLCNGIYTVAVDFMGGDPQNCGGGFTCSLGYAITTRLTDTELEKINVSFYPNPTNDILNISINSYLFINTENLNQQNCSITITNTFGQLIHTYNYSLQTIDLDLSDYTSGIYFVTIKSGYKTKTFKIIKE